MHFLGLFLIIAAVVLPLPLFADLLGKHDNIALLSQYLGAASLILMSISQIMATRAKGLELIFGGLDRMYLLHKWIGVSAMVFMMLHDTIDAEMRNLGAQTFLSDLAEESGEFALYGLLILVVISLTTFVPYELWKKTHKFIGLFFAMSAFHFAFISKPFANTDLLGLYINGFCALGVFCYLYGLLFHGFLTRKHPYSVSRISTDQGVTTLNLTPQKRGLKHKAGQFAFLSALDETHPFTIASGPKDGRELTFCMKSLGDFTKRLTHHLKEGDTVHLSRPFGTFKLPRTKKQVWIAGGIGVTPFLAWLDSLADDDPRDIHLFYCLRAPQEQIPFLNELSHPRVHVHIINSTLGNRLNSVIVKEELGVEIDAYKFFYCGPKSLRDSLSQDFKLHYEIFEMRSGLNLTALEPVLGRTIQVAQNYMKKRRAFKR